MKVSLWAMYQNVPKAISPPACRPKCTPLEKNAKNKALIYPTFLSQIELARRNIKKVVSIETRISVIGIAVMDTPNILNINA